MRAGSDRKKSPNKKFDAERVAQELRNYATYLTERAQRANAAADALKGQK